jgi:NADP-dependent 3-hydroxy acid dehydrogenase YdfG
MADFTGQIAIVTGASSGIGKAIALSLAKQGATACLIGRNLESLQAVAKSDPAFASRVQCHKSDLTLDEDLLGLTTRIQQDFEHVDLLVHSAGGICLGRIETVPVEDLDWQYRLNVRAPYVLTQALLPMIRWCRGQIVFINSSASLASAKANSSQYAATKYALKAIADSLRSEVNAEGIRVLSIYPGRTASPMQATVHRLEGQAYYPERLLQPEDVAKTVISAITLPRSAEVTDISLRPLVKSY